MRIKRKNEKGIVQVGMVVIILAAIGITVYLATQSRVFRMSDASEFTAREVTTEIPAIENEDDLVDTLEELENTKVDRINEMLFENDSDASGF